MSTDLDQLKVRAESAEKWKWTFGGLGGTPEIAWAFYKGLENNKIAWQEKAEAAEALVAELREALADMRSLYSQFSINGVLYKKVEAALAKTPADMGAEMAKLRGFYSEIVKVLGHDLVLAEIARLRQQLAERDAEIARLTAQHPVNTNVRLFDLVRHQRSELLKQDLITESEYAILCMHRFPDCKKTGSPSPRRLEDYDALRARVAELEEINRLRVPGSCQCGDDDLCAMFKRAERAEARNARLIAAGDESCIPCELIGFACNDQTLTIRFDRPIMDLPKIKLGQRVGFSPLPPADDDGLTDADYAELVQELNKEGQG